MNCGKKGFKIAVWACFVFICGCANHLTIDSQRETEVVRDKVSHTVDIETNTGSLITNALMNVSVKENQGFRVKTYEAKADYDVATPYQGGRELYEFPMGVVLLPVAVVINAVDFLTLGLLPDKFTDSILDWSFAGMNPFMNIESEGRFERTLVKTEKKLIDEKDEHLSRPLANKTLKVSAGKGEDMQVALDENGTAELSLIRMSALSEDIDKIKLAVESDNILGQKEIDVSRQLRSQLKNANSITNKYAHLAKSDVREEDVNQIDLTTFAEDLVRLSDLGFESESLRIEKKAMSLMSEEQKIAFKDSLDKALNKVN